MRMKTFLAAGLLFAAAPAAAAPFAILHMDADALQLVDLDTIRKTGSTARYESILMMREGPQIAEGVLDRMIHRKEADCAGQRARITQLAIAVKGGKPVPPPWAFEDAGWTEVEAEELRLVCTGQVGALQVIPALDVARVILDRNPASRGR